MWQNGVSPPSMCSSEMLMLPRRWIRLAMKPTGNKNPRATKKYRRHRYVLPVRIIRKNSVVMNRIAATAPM